MMPSCSTRAYRTARRQHTCVECRTTIQPGDVYEYASGVWEGRPESFKTCMPCLDSRNYYEGDCDSASFREEGAYTFGQLEQDLIDFAGECQSGTGVKFGAYRHAIGIKRRRNAAREQHNQALVANAAARGNA